jgi:hypothetical protein
MQNTLKIFLILLLAINVTLSAKAEDYTKSVEAVGYGENYDTALADAQRNAIELALGMVIGGESLVRNYEMVSDLVLSSTIGYVKNISVLNQLPLSNGGVELLIKAEVGALLDDLAREKNARDLILSWLNKPTVSMEILENNSGDTLSQVANNCIGQHFVEAGFHVKGLNDNDLEGRDGYNSSDQIRPVLKVVGRALSEEGSTPELMKKAGMKSYQALIEASLLQEDRQIVLTSHQATSAATHINASSGGAKALEQAASEVAERLIHDVIVSWAVEKANTTPIEVAINSCEYGQKESIRTSFSSVNGVRQVYEQDFSDGKLQLLIEMEGNAKIFADRVDGSFLLANGWQINQVSWSRVEIGEAD